MTPRSAMFSLTSLLSLSASARLARRSVRFVLAGIVRFCVG
jgi:hypothetical protein